MRCGAKPHRVVVPIDRRNVRLFVKNKQNEFLTAIKVTIMKASLPLYVSKTELSTKQIFFPEDNN